MQQGAVDAAWCERLAQVLEADNSQTDTSFRARLASLLGEMRAASSTSERAWSAPFPASADKGLDEEPSLKMMAALTAESLPVMAPSTSETVAQDELGAGAGESGPSPQCGLMATRDGQRDNRPIEGSSDAAKQLCARLSREAQQTSWRNREARHLLERLVSRLELATELPELLRLDAGLLYEVREIAAAHEKAAAGLDLAVASLNDLANDNKRLYNELEHVRAQSLTDELTGLPNRRALLGTLRAEIGRARRHPVTFCVALLDLDEFKAVNDQHGHATGDAMLERYASEMRATLRAQDLVARYGGEEFAVLLPGSALDSATRALTKIQDALQQQRIEVAGAPLTLPTFSAGVVEHISEESPEAILARADRSLYQAKQAGRDRVSSDGSTTNSASAGD